MSFTRLWMFVTLSGRPVSSSPPARSTILQFRRVASLLHQMAAMFAAIPSRLLFGQDVWIAPFSWRALAMAFSPNPQAPLTAIEPMPLEDFLVRQNTSL